jgi:pyruvate/2-oxoglutarate dehydrogenase complex dihydrolipoamide acyltransferase (E2) component
MSGGSSQNEQSSDDEDDDDDSSKSSTSGTDSLPQRSTANTEARAVPATVTRQASSATDTASEQVQWDELAQLINRNLMAAASQNASHIGIDLSALQTGALTYTPRPTDRSLPAALAPTELQFRVSSIHSILSQVKADTSIRWRTILSLT